YCAVMLRQPVPEQRVRHTDANGAFALGDKRRRLEPRIEAVSIDFGLDAGQDLVPNVAAVHCSRTFRLRVGDSCPGAYCQARVLRAICRAIATFAPMISTIFSTAVENFGGSPYVDPAPGRGEGAVTEGFKHRN